MATDFISQALRKVIKDHSATSPEQALQSFELRQSDVGTMRALTQLANGLYTPDQLAAIKNLRNSSQTVDMYLYKKRELGTGNTRLRQGQGSAETATVTPSFFDVVEEGLDISLVNQALRQYGSEGADKQAIVRAAYENHLSSQLPQLFSSIYQRINTQYVAWLEANKWALGTVPDDGTVYGTILGDAKQIPNSDKLDIFQNLQIEATQNNFNVNGRPIIIMSSKAKKVFDDYAARGGNNEINIAQFAGWFDPVFDNNIVDNAGVAATFYVIYPGGVGGYQRVFPWGADPDASAGGTMLGNDGWKAPISVGGNEAAFLTNLPQIDLEVKTFAGYADTSAIYPGEDAANIDIIRNWSFVTQHGAMKAYDSTVGKSPIIKYELLES